MNMRIRSLFRPIANMLLAGCFIAVFGCGRASSPPIGGEVRYGFLSKSVLVLYNSSHESLDIMVTFVAPNGEMQRHPFVIRPLSKLEIGALEMPWNFVSGETAIVSVSGYKKKLYVKNNGNQYRTWYE